jgi:hypothetical protein
MSLRWQTKHREATRRWLGVLTVLWALGWLGLEWPYEAMAATAEYGNQNFISIPSSFPPGTANPYPSEITVAGVPGNITNVTVTLRDIEHGTPSTVEVLLAGPDNSTNVVLMADVGNDTVTDEIYIEFDDAAASSLPCFGSGPLPSGPP